MNDEDEDLCSIAETTTAIIILTLVGLSLLMCGSPVHCQERHDDGLDLARLAVHESGWEYPEETAAIYAVAMHGAERTGMTWQRWLAVHSPRFAAHTVQRSWVYRLDREAHDPRAGISWATHRDRWLAYLAAADAAIGAPVVCVARTWGGIEDYRRRRARGIFDRVVSCGDTRNIYSVSARQ